MKWCLKLTEIIEGRKAREKSLCRAEKRTLKKDRGRAKGKQVLKREKSNKRNRNRGSGYLSTWREGYSERGSQWHRASKGS